jgi:4-hydroxy-tetrahydrodipicolinate reductase
MQILLLGYGKMGKEIEKIALSRNHSIVARIDSAAARNEFTQTANVDVAIEFSQPNAAIDNMRFCFDHDIPVVCGTTGWLPQKEEVENYCTQKNGTLLYSSNFSLGVNIFFRLNERLAMLMREQNYTASIDEIHHTQKKDIPSGTAITLADGIIKNNSAFKAWTLEDNPFANKIVIRSHRIDPEPGKHVVKYHSAIDDIEISHKAHTREGFALGAVKVAEWLQNKKGIYTMTDFLGF